MVTPDDPVWRAVAVRDRLPASSDPIANTCRVPVYETATFSGRLEARPPTLIVYESPTCIELGETEQGGSDEWCPPPPPPGPLARAGPAVRPHRRIATIAAPDRPRRACVANLGFITHPF